MPQTEPSATTPHLSDVDVDPQLLATVLSSIPDCVYAFNRQRRFAFANAAMLKLFGLSAEEMLGKTFAELGYPDELADRLNGHIGRVLREGITIEDEVFFPAPTGHSAYFRFLWSPVHSADGAVELVVGLSRETTQRRATEEELRKSEAQFRSFADNSSNLIWIGDPAEATIIFRSAAFERIWGTPCTDTPASMTEWLLTVHSEDRGRVHHALDTVMGGEVVQFDYRIIRPVDGKIRWLRDTSFPIFDEMGAVSRIGGITEDLNHKEFDQVYIVSAKPDEARRLSMLVRGIGRQARPFTGATVFVDLAAVLVPGYVLVDLRCEREEGLSMIRALRTLATPFPTIALDLPELGAAVAVSAMKAGAVDYLVVSEDEAALRNTIATAIAESQDAIRRTGQDFEAGAQVAGLTRRESEVLAGLAAGGTNKTIAKQLGISPRTVELHRSQIMKRLNVSSLAELLQIGFRAGLAPSIRTRSDVGAAKLLPRR